MDSQRDSVDVACRVPARQDTLRAIMLSARPFVVIVAAGALASCGTVPADLGAPPVPQIHVTVVPVADLPPLDPARSYEYAFNQAAPESLLVVLWRARL